MKINNIKYKHIHILFVSVLLVMACSDRLDIDTATKKNLDNFINNQQDLENAIIGVYGILQDEDVFDMGWITLGDIAGDDIKVTAADQFNSRFDEIDKLNTGSGNFALVRAWRNSYRAIQQINIILSTVDAISFTNETLKQHRKGELFFIRSLLYYHLVNAFGDIPYVKQVFKDPSEAFSIDKTAKDAVLRQLVDELNLAIANLPLEKTIARPAKGAAQALLVQVYMLLNDNEKALQVVESLIASNQYQLLSDVTTIFSSSNESNSEVLFDIHFSLNTQFEDERRAVAGLYLPFQSFDGASGQMIPTSNLLSIYDPIDNRMTAYFGTIAATNQKYIRKYVSDQISATTDINHIALRYSEIILRYAELLNEADRTNEALMQLNKIRNRAGLTDFASNDKIVIRNEIRTERRRELVGEGYRWYDLKRYGNVVDHMNQHFKDEGLDIVVEPSDIDFASVNDAQVF